MMNTVTLTSSRWSRIAAGFTAFALAACFQGAVLVAVATAETAAAPASGSASAVNASPSVEGSKLGESVKAGVADLKSRFDQWRQDLKQHQPQPAVAKAEPAETKGLLPNLFQPRPSSASAPQAAVQKPTPQGDVATPARQAWSPKLGNLKPRTAASLVRSGGNAESRGDLEGAMRWYRFALKIDPANTEAQAKLAAAQAAQAKLEPAPVAPKKFQLFKKG